jgi:DNA sulfur modification protein DndD
MLFQELVLENFSSYLGKNIIDLTPNPATGETIILLGGMNGSGKTTIMDALRLVLYGARAQCSTRGSLAYGDFLDRCIHPNLPPTENTRIELVFSLVEDDTQKTLRVVRYWQRNPKEGKDNLSVFPDDGYINDPGLVNVWDEYIENILPLGISNLFLFDGERVKELAEQEAPPPAVYEAIESLLGLELSQRLAADLEVLLNRKRRELANTKQLTDIDEIESRLVDRNNQLTAIELRLEELESDLTTARASEERALEKFIQAGGQLALVKSELQSRQHQIERDIDLERGQLRSMAVGVLPLAFILPLLAEIHDRGQQESQYSYSPETLDAIARRDRDLIAYLDSDAELTDLVTKVRQFFDLHDRELAASLNLENIDCLNADRQTLIDINLLLTAGFDRDYQIISDIDTKLNNYHQELDELDRQMAEAAAPEEYDRLRKQQAKTRDRVSNLQAEIIDARRQHEELTRQIAKIKQELSSYTEANLKSVGGQHIIDSIARVKSTLHIFKEKLTLKKIDRLENEVTECFRYLLHKSELVHRVSIDSETFILSLYDREGRSFPKQRLSAGEKQLLAIALLWGLARVSGRQLPITIDTPLGRLDSSHRTNLIERYFPAASEQVILLSTDTEIGAIEAEKLRTQSAIAREYLLVHDSIARRTKIESGYFTVPSID